MLNLSDNELDRLSRDAAEHYKAPTTESVWEKIAGRLNKEMPVEKKYRRRIGLLLLLLLFLGGGAGYLLTRSGSENTKALQSQQNSGGKNIQNVDQPKEKENRVNAGIQKIKLDSKTEENKVSPDLKIVQLDKSVGEVTEGPNSSKDTRSGKLKSDPNRMRTSRKSESRPLSEKTKTSEAADQTQIAEKESDGVSPQEMKEASKSVEAPKSKVPSPLVTSKDQNSKPAEEKTTEPTKKETRKQNNKQSSSNSLRRWEIGAVYSPDMSNVKFTHSDQIGTNVGITLGYNFSRRWSVNTGFLYTIKHYTTSGENYKFPPNYWASNPNVEMKEVKATCTMYDIPINVRYNWLAKKNDLAFVSVGLSSYLMREEEFDYDYTYYNNPYYRQWTNGKNSNYFLSIANISVGYEHQINPAISLQAEPFLKFSLSDVGFGSVQLNSYGMFIGVKYKPTFGKKTGSKSPVLSEK